MLYQLLNNLNPNLYIKRDTQELKKVREFVSNTLQTMNVSEIEANMMVLAVDEICANRILYAPNRTNPKDIILEIIKESGKITFKISDTGDLYDINLHNSLTIDQLIEDKKKGGIGLMLVKKIMDSIEISRSEPYTVFLLRKNLQVA
jgi:serine/threonine-protein kinase RsbW